MVRSFCLGREHHFASPNQLAASTALQMLLYLNVLFSLSWAILFPLLLQWKIGNWEPPIYISILTPLLFITWLVVEPLRRAQLMVVSRCQCSGAG